MYLYRYTNPNIINYLQIVYDCDEIGSVGALSANKLIDASELDCNNE